MWRRKGRHRADEALAESQKERLAAEARRHETRSIASALKEIRNANHFAENIRKALGEEGP